MNEQWKITETIDFINQFYQSSIHLCVKCVSICLRCSFLLQSTDESKVAQRAILRIDKSDIIEEQRHKININSR